jgi:anthranilate phosphoribosyltransferase
LPILSSPFVAMNAAGNTHEEEGPSLASLIAQVALRQDLSVEQAEAAFTTVMQGRASVIQIAALLVGLRTKGEAPEEVAGGVRAMRGAMIPVEASADPRPVVDTCGTGGGAMTTFNISTAAALLAAGAGVRIAKHGNRSFTSRCGSADVLEALDVPVEMSPEAMAEVLAEAGIVFMFAPLLHPAMRHVIPVRRELGMSTIMNVLGPLTNPASARRQVVGVADPALLHLIARALLTLGHDHALVVHGQPGMDELSPLAPTEVLEVKNGRLNATTLDPQETFGWKGFDADGLAGRDPDHNATVVRGVLSGEVGGVARAAVVLNAGAAIYVAGLEPSLEKGVARAESVLDEGRGMEALARLREATRHATA